MPPPGVAQDRHPPAGAGAPDLQRVADRIEAVVREIGELTDPRARQQAEELVGSIMELYGGGLARVLAVARQSEPGGERLVEALCDDALVSHLLILHGLHPVSLGERVRRGLERIGALLLARGGRVEILSASEDAVRVRFTLAGDACGSSNATLAHTIEQAVAEAAPDARRIAVENVPAVADGAPLMQIQGLKGSRGR